MCCVHFYRFYSVRTSYLEVPRIHFKGKYRADVTTRNNCQCNFDTHKVLIKRQEWNYGGTSEWEFVDTYITSIIDGNGKEIKTSPLIGGKLSSNVEGPLPKVVDLDVDFQVTSIYGMKIYLHVDGEIILQGEWMVSVLVRDMWNKLKCGKPKHPLAEYGTISTSKISGIECPKMTRESLNLCRAWNTTKLAVSLSLSYFSGDIFTIGDVIGTIGIAKEREPLNVGGDRKLESTGQPLRVCPNADPIHNGVNIAPFIYDKSRKILVFDISNTFPSDMSNNKLDLGNLWIGVLNNGAVTIFGESLPYLHSNTWNKGGVVEYVVPSELESTVQNFPMVIVKEVEENSSGDNTYPHKHSFSSLSSSKVVVLLQEMHYFVRPMGYYHGRMEYGNRNCNSTKVTLLVTTFGRPVNNIVVVVNALNAVPAGGVIAQENFQTSDKHGLVTFLFQANRSIPLSRLYKQHPCITGDCPDITQSEKMYEINSTGDTDILHRFPIDGQVYHFCYFVAVSGKSIPSCEDIFPKIAFTQVISFLSFSSIFYKRPYTWIDHVRPIFEQVHHLHHIMSTVLDMSSYHDVTQPYNIKLLKSVLSKDINDAGYMPVTRNLSPRKMKMIQEWLDRPCYSELDCITKDTCQHPPPKSQLRYKDEWCNHSRFPSQRDPIMHTYAGIDDSMTLKNPPRPLFGYSTGKAIPLRHTDVAPFPICNVESLKSQLELAVQLEFSTIPLYLTSLYTIMDNCNVKAYELMRNIVVQEMLHFAQAANILIAIGGKVTIDSKETVPHYPIATLPGGVLPSVSLTLEKFSLDHVFRNFMAIEVPAHLAVTKPHLNTIGEFYNEIQECVLSLGDELFDNVNEEIQVDWPWETQIDVGKLYRVRDMASAQLAIEQIKEQSEGADAQNPVDESTKHFAHYFRFKEIFCERELERLPGGEGYAYIGNPIPYNSNGVWNMKKSLAISDIEKGSVCYTQARTFHSSYRKLLFVLQDTFGGNPGRITEALKLMEVLKVHAKKALWTPLKAEAVRTPVAGEIMCGPIWDYEWNE